MYINKLNYLKKCFYYDKQTQIYYDFFIKI